MIEIRGIVIGSVEYISPYEQSQRVPGIEVGWQCVAGRLLLTPIIDWKEKLVGVVIAYVYCGCYYLETYNFLPVIKAIGPRANGLQLP